MIRAMILHRITQWQRALPKVQAQPGFRLSSVASRWRHLLGDPATVQSPTKDEAM